jgi:hypothetical protein
MDRNKFPNNAIGEGWAKSLRAIGRETVSRENFLFRKMNHPVFSAPDLELDLLNP